MNSQQGARADFATPASGFEITSPTAGSLVPCGQPVTVTWTGGNPSDMVNVVLIDVQNFQVYQGFGVEPNTGSRVVTIGPGSCGRQSAFYVEDSPRTTWTYGPVFNVTSGSTCTPPPANMVSWWPGDGNANDIQGCNNGTLQNGVTFATGEVGQAFSFAGGLHDFVEVPYNANLDLTQALTIDAWVNPSGVHQHGGIVETGGLNAQYSLHIESGKVLFRLIVVPGVDHRTIQSDSVIPTNTWTHVAGTWDGVIMKLYINGVQQAQTQNVSPPINSGGGTTQIGYTDVNPYAGLIDEVEIFSRALSSDEIRAIYLADSAGKCKPAFGTTPPTVSCPSPTTVSADSNCQVPVPNVLGGVTAPGGCGGPVTLSQSPAAGTLVGLGTTTITVTATDSSNNSTSCTTSFTVTDATSPTITVNTPSNGAAYLLNQSVAASYSCADCGGVASCLGPVASGSNINTASTGLKSFTVTASDNSGNSAIPKSVSYTVSYGVRVLFDQSKAAKSGSTIPIKIQLVDANGNNVSSSSVVVHAVSVTQTSSSASVILDDAGQANPDFDFRYDSSLGGTGGYIFNLKTTDYGTGTYILNYNVAGDPVTHSVQFQVRQ